MTFEISPTNRVRQLSEKGRYDEESVNAILDAGLVAQVAFIQEGSRLSCR